MQNTALSFALQIRAALAEQADPVKSAPMAAYMKHRFCFFGVPTPMRRKLTKPLLAAIGRSADSECLIAVAEALWAFEERECQYAAVDLLIKNAKRLLPEHEPRLAALVCDKAWWDSVDGLAASVYGELVAAHPGLLPVLDGYAEHESIWLRRVAILYQLHYAGATDLMRLSAALEANLGHPDFFIGKAMGWALRQYARTDPSWVRAWLDEQGANVPPLTRREAVKHLCAADSV